MITPHHAEQRSAALPCAEDVPYYRQVARELRDMGMELASIIKASLEPKVGSEQNSLLDAATAFERLSRAVRRAILLDGRLRTVSAAKVPTSGNEGRSRILREVEDAIARQEKDRQGWNPELLGDADPELEEELENPADEIGDEPPADILAQMCRDLGIATACLPSLPLWKRRTAADVTRVCARAAGRIHTVP